MVIVLLGVAAGGTKDAARMLADRLGWTCEVVGRGDDVRAIAARALDRREPLVLVWPSVDVAHAADVLAGLRPVRFVTFQSSPEPVPFQALAVDAAADVEVLVGRVRLEFGL